MRTRRAPRATRAQWQRTSSGIVIAGHRRQRSARLPAMALRRALTLLLPVLAALAAAIAGCGDASSSSGGGGGGGAKKGQALPRVELALDFTANAVHAP